MKDWGKVVAGLSIVALIWLLLSTFTSTQQKTTASTVPGWDDLILCSELVSFDGKKTLSLSDDGTAELDDKSGTEQRSTKGKWELGNRPGLYVMHFDNKRQHYERIAPEGRSSCMLIFGTSFAANLQLSWFAVEPEMDQPDQ